MGFNIGDIFNPIGLIGDVLQGIEGMVNPSKDANQAGAAQSGNNMLNMLGGGGMQNIVQSFTGGSSSSGASSAAGCTDPSQRPATTECPTSPTCCPQGYASSSTASSPSDCNPSSSSSSSDSCAPGDNSAMCASSSQAATAAPPPPPVDPDKLKAMESLVGNFSTFDSQLSGSWIKDGQFDMNNVDNILANKEHFSDSVIKTAQYLKDNPELFDQMAMLSGGNGEVNAQSAQQVLNQLIQQQAASQMPQPAPQTVTPPAPPAAAEPASAQGTMQHLPPKAAHLTNSSTSPSTGSSGTPPVFTASGSTALSNLQGEIEDYASKEEDYLEQQVQTAMTSGDTAGTQKFTEQLTRMTELFSNIEKMLQDAMMNTISNTR